MFSKPKNIIILGLVLMLIGGGLWFFSPEDGAVITENKPNVENLPEPVVDKNPKVMPEIYPVTHASLVMRMEEQIIYIDPTGEDLLYTKYGLPTAIVITHSHGDHFDIPLLEKILVSGVTAIVPEEVYNLLPAPLQSLASIMKNGDFYQLGKITIEAVPMYNTSPEKTKFHVKGVGNGYVFEGGEARVYVAGDTEDTPEMRALKNIDIAFIPMNEPYTMGVEAAASGVLAFSPKQVYPYHYRGKDGKSDVIKFKDLVMAENPDIEVTLAEWYSETSE